MRFESILAAALPALVLAAPTPQDPDFTWDDQTPEESIVGGTAAAAGEFPFIASLQLNGRHLCGGTLINANTIVTAAHCSERSLIGGPANVRVRLGSLNNASGGTLVSVSQVISHPNYRENGKDYDIAIWKLSSSVPAGGNIAYANIAAANSDPAGGATTTVAGWGALREGGSASATLQKVSVPVVARTTCNSQYGGSITSRMFCAGFTAGGRDSCQGDSGGPIVDSSKTLIGVVSWGNGCARPNFPGVYARVGALTSFIQQNA